MKKPLARRATLTVARFRCAPGAGRFFAKKPPVVGIKWSKGKDRGLLPVLYCNRMPNAGYSGYTECAVRNSKYRMHGIERRAGTAHSGGMNERSFESTFQHARDLHFDFLRVELDMGMCFARIALHADGDLDRRRRNQTNARKAYDAVLRFMDYFPLSAGESEQVQEKLSQLENQLMQIGG